MSNQRFVILAFVLGSAFFTWVLQGGISSAFMSLSWEDTLVGGVFATSSLIGLACGAACFVGLLTNASAVRFTDEVVGELRRVTWPTREEAIQATTTVVFTAVFVSAIIGVYDFVWKNVADFFLFTQG